MYYKKYKSEKIVKIICILYSIGAVNILGGWGIWPLSSTHTSNTFLCLFEWGLDVNKWLLFFVLIINWVVIIGAVIAVCKSNDTMKIFGYVVIVLNIVSDIVGNIYCRTHLVSGDGGTLTCPIVLTILIDVLCMATMIIQIVKSLKVTKISKEIIMMIIFSSILVIILAVFNMYLFVSSSRLYS